MTLLVPQRSLSTAHARPRRPLWLSALLAGLLAALGPLTVCLAWGVIGWFVTDAGAHGQPSDGLRVGALAWLAAHGSGVVVGGAAITAMPLLLSWLSAVVVWRSAHRCGESVAPFGPDADGLANGERDWTVPLSTGIFAGAYGAVAWLTLSLAGADRVASVPGLILGGSVIAAGIGGAAIAAGSGRAAILVARFPLGLRAASSVGGRIARNLAWVALAVVAASMLWHLDDAATMASGIRADTGDSVLFWLANGLLLPNAVGMGAAYLLGPGFAVGAGTLVSPSSVTLGPLPLTPWLAALPPEGPSPEWVRALIVVPMLIAAVTAARGHLRYPTASLLDGALRAVGAGMVAAAMVAIGVWLSGGAVGPGRMRVFGAESAVVLTYGVAVLGIGALLGGLIMTWWWRRTLAQNHPATNH
jgi:hypothetical protein